MSRTCRVGAALFLLALAPRLGWVAWLELRGGGLRGPDAPSYDALATHLLAGKGLQMDDYPNLFASRDTLTVRSFRPPLLPIVFAGIYGLAGHHLVATRLAMALLGAATCVLVWRIGRQVFDARAGAVAGVLAAVYPKLVYYNGLLVTETLCTFLLALAVSVLLGAREAKRGGWRWPVAGAVLGLAALSRSSLLLFPLAVGAWRLLEARARRRAAAQVALVLAGFVAVMVPWWVRNAAVHGRFVPATTEGGYTFWVTNNPRATGGGHCFWPEPRGDFDGLSEVEIDREFYRRGWRWVRTHPGLFLRLSAAKFVRFWRLWPHAEEPGVGLAAAIVAGATFTPVLLLALWGAVAARSRWRPLLLFYMMFLYFTLLHMVFMAITRYRLPLEPYLILLASWGLVDLRDRLRRRPSQAERPR